MRRIIQSTAEEHGISGQVQRISSTVVRVLAVSKIREDVVEFVDQVKAAFPVTALGAVASPGALLDPTSIIAESADSELIRMVILGAFKSIYSRFKKQYKKLSSNDDATAPSSQSEASCGSGGMGGPRPGLHKFSSLPPS